MRPRSDPSNMKNSNVVRSRQIILINEEINEANWMVSNSAKIDRRTKQHTQFGVSASNGSRDMARTKVEEKKGKKEKKRKKKNEHAQNHIASPMGIANNHEKGSRSPRMRQRSDPPNFGPITK